MVMAENTVLTPHTAKAITTRKCVFALLSYPNDKSPRMRMGLILFSAIV